jgi:hypothetical protein
MNLKKILIGGAAGALLLGVAFIPAFANNGPSNNKQIFNEWPVNHNPIGNNGPKNASLYNPGNELSNSKCTTPTTGKPIINVSQKVQNDADSGVGGYWAFDYFTRQITVWTTGTTGTYCAVVTYNGNFYAVPGQINPEDLLNNAVPPTGQEINTPTDEPINGPFSGGYRAILTGGTLLATPLWTTHGSVPTTNYQCDLTGNCPGNVNWVTQYFSGIDVNNSAEFNQEWWGWKYNGGSHGTWINASTGNSGDIL